MASKEDDKNWKGILISIGCISLILTSVIVSVIILTPPKHLEDEIPGKRYKCMMSTHNLLLAFKVEDALSPAYATCNNIEYFAFDQFLHTDKIN